MQVEAWQSGEPSVGRLSPRARGAIGAVEQAHHEAGQRQRCGRDLSGGRRFRCSWRSRCRGGAAEPAPIRTGRATPLRTQIVDVQRRPGHLRQRCRRRDRERRGADEPRGQLSRRRPGDLGPQDRPGSRAGQRRPADAAGRQAGRRQCPADRHACATGRSTICWSCSKAAAASPRAAGRASTASSTLDNAIYSPCPVTTRDAAARSGRAGRSPRRG